MNTTQNTMAKETKANRRVRLLEAHYDLCGKLGAITGSKFNGKQISIQLFYLETLAHNGATASCNGETFITERPRGLSSLNFSFGRDENAWYNFCEFITEQLRDILGSVPKGFFVNGDARGYALKLEEKSIDLPMHTDWGRYQILSPDLTNE